MIIGFTGTRKGMTDEQCDRVAELCNILQDGDCVEHGGAEGADRQFHDICYYHLEGDRLIHVTIWPGPHTELPTQELPGIIICPRRPYLERNHLIVDRCDKLIACPAGKAEEQRSGTWATIRYARKIRKHLIIVWPSGSTYTQNFKGIE